MTLDSNDVRTAVASAVAAVIGELLIVAECAEILRVTPAKIYEDIEQGLIRDVIKVGTRRGYRVPVEAFLEYADGLKITASASSPDLALVTPVGA